MKNLGLLVLGVILGALAMYFFCCTSTDMGAEGPEATPKGLISPKEAKVLDRAYNMKHNIINDSLFKNSTDGGDNRSSWWAIKNIENYIAYAKNQAKENGYMLDGLRLYLGSYPNTNTETGLTTMFFIPTGYENTSEGNMLYFPQGDGKDIPGGTGLNHGGSGVPPSANYPQ
ncbi:hypothetical protein [Winogradskyella ursingii]|uniref:hypothetical protein n=1 Tax=Winogradskyella ursingii TaxID=2686079 RepID=UPI0015CB6DC9|nr:hypothetical protein [Winogradskyella ursingii]